MSQGQITGKIEGDKALIKALKRLGDEAERVIGPATMAGAEIVKAEIERRAPVDSGELKAQGFRIKRGSMTEGAYNAVITLTERLFEYAFYIEFGVKNRKRGGTLPARPFIRRAFMAKRKEAQEAIGRVIKQLVS